MVGCMPSEPPALYPPAADSPRERACIPPRIAAIGLRLFLQMVLVDNFTHADLHPGNMLVRFVRPDGSTAAAPEDVGAMLLSAPCLAVPR